MKSDKEKYYLWLWCRRSPSIRERGGGPEVGAHPLCASGERPTWMPETLPQKRRKKKACWNPST